MINYDTIYSIRRLFAEGEFSGKIAMLKFIEENSEEFKKFLKEVEDLVDSDTASQSYDQNYDRGYSTGQADTLELLEKEGKVIVINNFPGGPMA